jgi:hypothetical protein
LSRARPSYGKAIVDRQHPHDFFMEIAALYDRTVRPQVGEHGLPSIYAAPVGDPTLGPEAYPHRASAGEDPLAPLSHHLQDSTHIAYDIVTGGITINAGRAGARLEASGFHGREPDENRWHIEVGAVDAGGRDSQWPRVAIGWASTRWGACIRRKRRDNVTANAADRIGVFPLDRLEEP